MRTVRVVQGLAAVAVVAAQWLELEWLTPFIRGGSLPLWIQRLTFALAAAAALLNVYSQGRHRRIHLFSVHGTLWTAVAVVLTFFALGGGQELAGGITLPLKATEIAGFLGGSALLIGFAFTLTSNPANQLIYILGLAAWGTAFFARSPDIAQAFSLMGGFLIFISFSNLLCICQPAQDGKDLQLASWQKLGVLLPLLLWTDILLVPSFLNSIDHVWERLLHGASGAVAVRIYRNLLTYECAMRIHLLFLLGFAILFIAYALAKNSRADVRPRITLWILLCGAMILLPVLAFDFRNALSGEASWITFFTSLALGVGAFVATINAVICRSQDSSPNGRKLQIFWLLLAGAFFFATTDESLEIHENLGHFVENSLDIPHYLTDLITLSYAVCGIAVIVYFLRTFKQEYLGKGKIFYRLFIGAGLTFLLGMCLDTFDFIVEDWAKSQAAVWGEAGRLFDQTFYGAYDLHRFLNSLEEVLEFSASLLFLSAFMVAPFEAETAGLKNWSLPSTTDGRQKRMPKVIAIMAGCMAWGAIGVGFSFRPSGGIIQEQDVYHLEKVAGPENGLLHADGLAYDRTAGLVVANEGGKNVISISPSGEARILADASSGLCGPESVVIHEGDIYVSDESGKIFCFDKEGTARILIDAEQLGAGSPEGLAFDEDGALYFGSESTQRIFRVDRLGCLTVWADLQEQNATPEELAFGPNGNLFVTDDRGGRIFKISKDGEVQLFVDTTAGIISPEGLAFAPDGALYVGDSTTGTIWLLQPDQSPQKIISFSRNYRDLQGLSIDQEDNVYVVTADGYGSVSWMPSFIFKISRKATAGR